MNCAAALHQFQFIAAFYKAQAAQQAVNIGIFFKRHIFAQHIQPVNSGFSAFHIHNFRTSAIKFRQSAEALHRADILQQRFIAGTVIASAYPQNFVLRTDNQRALLHCTCKIVHINFIINNRHLPAGMFLFHFLTETRKACLQFFERYAPYFVSHQRGMFQYRHSIAPYTFYILTNLLMLFDHTKMLRLLRLRPGTAPDSLTFSLWF